MPNLSQLKPGMRGKIISLAGNDFLSQRLMEMGLLEGDAVEVVAVAPFGDPMEVRLGSYCLSLRKSEAARVEVEMLVT
jgi:ferrous iron transport protein A